MSGGWFGLEEVGGGSGERGGMWGERDYLQTINDDVDMYDREDCR
jgi:hypothetical protein